MAHFFTKIFAKNSERATHHHTELHTNDRPTRPTTQKTSPPWPSDASSRGVADTAPFPSASAFNSPPGLALQSDAAVLLAAAFGFAYSLPPSRPRIRRSTAAASKTAAALRFVSQPPRGICPLWDGPDKYLEPSGGFGVHFFARGRDARALRRRGIERPFGWGWAVLVFVATLGVYIVGRTVVVRRRTGRGWAPLWGWLAALVFGLAALSLWLSVVVDALWRSVTLGG